MSSRNHGGQIIAVAERVHAPGITWGRAAAWRDRWVERPLQMIWMSPCMEGGATATRFEKMCGSVTPDRKVNLLPPSPKCGSWDAPLASKCAAHLLEWLDDTDGRIICLGRRVTDAFEHELDLRSRVEFYKTFHGGRLLCVPHPSGRSRATDFDAARDAIYRLSQAEKFVGGPFDGHWINVEPPSTDMVQIVVPIEIPAHQMQFDPNNPGPEIQTALYERQVWVQGSRRWAKYRFVR